MHTLVQRKYVAPRRIGGAEHVASDMLGSLI